MCDYIASFYQIAFVQVNYMVDDKLKYLTFNNDSLRRKKNIIARNTLYVIYSIYRYR